MLEPTSEGQRILEDIAARHQVSADAALTLARALARGGGSQAQFDHPELGGMGQWSQGGMTMVGEMFDDALKGRVDALCSDLSAVLEKGDVFGDDRAQHGDDRAGDGGKQAQDGGDRAPEPPEPSRGSQHWWPAGLGDPDATGAQNDTRYAWFSRSRRLAIERDGGVQVYDTGEHVISGFSQQQGNDRSMTFNSQHGPVDVAGLPVVSGGDQPDAAAGDTDEPPPAHTGAPAGSAGDGGAPKPSGAPSAGSMEEVFNAIERLSDLRRKGIISNDEFSAKKADLLARI